MVRASFFFTALVLWGVAGGSAPGQGTGFGHANAAYQLGTELIKTEPTALAAGVHRNVSQPIGPEASAYGSRSGAQPDTGRNPNQVDDSSLGTMIRNRKEEIIDGAAREEFRAWLVGEADRAGAEASDDPREEHEDKEDEEEKEASARRESTSRHAKDLRKPIGEVRIQATESGKRVPKNRAAGYTRQEPLITIAALGATPPLPNRYTVGFMHRPLYFEQPNLERCGRSCRHLQNAISGARFLATTIMMPYHLCHQCPDCLVPAGGDCKTCQRYSIDCDPLGYDALITQAAATAGFSFLLL